MRSFFVCEQRLTGSQFIINCSQPVNDKIFDIQAFEKFLHDRIKVEGRTGNLGDNIQISQQTDGKIEVIAHQEFSGRYLKYLYVVLPLLVRTIERLLTIRQH
jgi:large subunit ribosomal protein L22e